MTWYTTVRSWFDAIPSVHDLIYYSQVMIWYTTVRSWFDAIPSVHDLIYYSQVMIWCCNISTRLDTTVSTWLDTTVSTWLHTAVNADYLFWLINYWLKGGLMVQCPALSRPPTISILPLSPPPPSLSIHCLQVSGGSSSSWWPLFIAMLVSLS